MSSNRAHNTTHLHRAAIIAMLLSLAACGTVSVPHYNPNFAGGDTFRGKASWYGPGFHGKQTASGERFNQDAMTAAHRSLPFGTIVRVINLQSGRSVEVRINDRGPFIRGRVIDLSRQAARELNMIQAGVVPVEVQIVRLARP